MNHGKEPAAENSDIRLFAFLSPQTVFIGSSSSPSKVFKGKKMAGRMGHTQITIRNLEVVRVDADENLILVKGSVPGAKKSLVTLKETIKVK